MTAPRLHVLVQAGGRGSRLRHHTWNKPKCLVSVDGKPILYHLFDRFPQARFVVIGDYMFDQLERYLQVNPPGVDYSLVKASAPGTLGGVADALQEIPADAPVVMAWSDLVLGDLPPWPQTELPVVCTTAAFTCRWTQAPEGHLHEKPGTTGGIPGLFYFPRASVLPPPPPSGEFVRWFARAVPDFATLDCPDLEELGDFSTIETSNDRAGFSRYFNHVEMGETRVTKTVVDHAFDDVHSREVSWYGAAKGLGFRRIPKVYGEGPLVLERIKGQHAYQMDDLTPRERRAVLADHLDSLISLHDLGRTAADADDVRQVYLDKTISRVRSISAMVPGFERKAMTVNGRKCRNPFGGDQAAPLEELIDALQPSRFVPIHGDATFSNTLVDDKLRTWFIDPRGYFAKPGVMGDEWYDFAKVYYSAVGGYDAFNRRKFKLHVDHETVEVLMEDSPFIPAAQAIFPEYFGAEMGRIEVIHGLIWLSLSGYARDDIDSAIAAFYMGLYWLETGLGRL
ncbi:NTP transferase domain-containing protein [Phenylobacterium aquaticum]|uniref:NTP transferase domain-containing protein n=1 Tax=Phenylobacterium aquaticum TaxID=1763816 RepID=UPI0026F140F4|nr:NTP transferase domain-containing protein [Phenylobacterium aquaticum]